MTKLHEQRHVEREEAAVFNVKAEPTQRETGVRSRSSGGHEATDVDNRLGETAKEPMGGGGVVRLVLVQEDRAHFEERHERSVAVKTGRGK